MKPIEKDELDKFVEKLDASEKKKTKYRQFMDDKKVIVTKEKEIKKELEEEIPPLQKPVAPQRPINLNLGALSDDDSISTEEAFAKIAMILANTKNVKSLTELSEQERNYVAMLLTTAEITHDDVLKGLLNNIMLLNVSLRRKGRLELLDLAKQSQAAKESRLVRLKQMLGGI